MTLESMPIATPSQMRLWPRELRQREELLARVKQEATRQREEREEKLIRQSQANHQRRVEAQAQITRLRSTLPDPDEEARLNFQILEAEEREWAKRRTA